MKRKLKLKKEVKAFIVITLYVAVMACLFIYGIERAEKINNGELTVVSQSEMDR